MAAVFPQVDYNSRCSSKFTNSGRYYRIWFSNPPGLSQCRNMIDVNGEFCHALSP
jgi:hypothetical protein